MPQDAFLSSATLADDVAGLRAEVADLRAEIARLRAEAAPIAADHNDRDGDDHDDHDDAVGCGDDAPAVTSRRRLFALAGGAAAAATVAAVATRATPAAANNGLPINVAETATATAALPVTPTKLDYTTSSNNNAGNSLFVVGDGAGANTSVPAAIEGYASKHVGVGVYGTSTAGFPLSVGVSGSSTDPIGVGVLGNSPNIAIYGFSSGSAATSAGITGASLDGYGVVAASVNNVDLWARGTGRFLMDSAVPAGPPTTGTFTAGELVRDDNFDFWVCTVGGAASQWRRLVPTPPALPPQLHVIEPTRVYDSRLPGFSGRINDGEVRQLSVANGIDISSGVVTVADVVPAGATAIQFTFTIDAAANNGFLAVTPGDAATFKASTINWSPTTPNIATGSLVKLDAVRNVRVFAGGGGSTHFLIDITGYYI